VVDQHAACSNQREHRARFLIIHAVLSLLYGGILTGEIALSIKYRASRVAYDRFMNEAFGWQVLYGIVLYGLVVGISYALQAARRLRDEERRAARSEALRIDAELRALRAQLNPHFLFNTLHSITALVRIDPADGERALEQFGASAAVRAGCESQSAARRYRSRKSSGSCARTSHSSGCAWAIASRSSRRSIPTPSSASSSGSQLQPLVENAIPAWHCAQGRRRDAAHCGGSSVGDQLVLEVADDGAGADGARVAEASGVGLSAVRSGWRRGGGPGRAWRS
jgi:hypothetical protein